MPITTDLNKKSNVKFGSAGVHKVDLYYWVTGGTASANRARLLTVREL